MNRLKLSTWICLWLILTAITHGNSQNWPGWRGPNGDGTSTEKNLPMTWDSVTNVIWKAEIPGTGHSSPIVWEDKLFTMSALPELQERILLCYDATNGSLLWEKTILKSGLEAKHNDNSYASGTPATDGKKIYISYLDGDDVVVAAYDYNGNNLWTQKPGTFSSPHGYSCSPVIYNDKIIINGNSKGDSFMAALHRDDGHILWKVPHPKAAHSFSTPIIRNMEGRTQMIFCGNQEIASYNPDTGAKYWFVNGPSEDFCSSPVYNEKSGLVLVSSAWPQRHLLAVDPAGNGDVTESHVKWRTTKGAFYVPSPASTGDYLLSTMTNGQVHCFDVPSGQILWVENLGKQYASPVVAGGLVYMPNDEGVITVIKPGPAFEYVAKNAIGERMNASPAISNGKIFLRGEKHLYCIGHR